MVVETDPMVDPVHPVPMTEPNPTRTWKQKPINITPKPKLT
jgi:hypothetical protein